MTDCKISFIVCKNCCIFGPVSIAQYNACSLRGPLATNYDDISIKITALSHCIILIDEISPAIS